MNPCNQFSAISVNPQVCENCWWDRQYHQIVDRILPRIRILATGGTIAGVAGNVAHATAYEAGVLTVENLLQAVPGLSALANIDAEQVENIDSRNMTTEIWTRLYERINYAFESGHVDGIVITHGTDTLEETAFFLYCTLKTSKPVVLTAAMKPANALGADGPLNLQNAVVTAACRESSDKGALVVMNGEIYSAHNVFKTNTHSIDAFKANESGRLGWIENNQVHYQHNFDISHLDPIRDRINSDLLSELPSVQIISNYTSPSPLMINALINPPVRGIVIAGTGDGTMHRTLETAAQEAVTRGIAIVRSSRVCFGHVTHDEHDAQAGFLSAGSLNPWKARILLMLLLAIGFPGQTECQTIFDQF